MSLVHIFESALGQLLAISLVVVAWTIVKLWQLMSTFAVAAWKTRVSIVCERRKPG